jgi:hypothetical protein
MIFILKTNTMDPKEFKRLLKEFAPEQQITEADIQPTGPDGEKITDPVIIKNLNLAIKAVNSAIRPKLIQMIEDPEAAKALKSTNQRAAVIAAMAIAFGISEKEFSQIIVKIKTLLKKSDDTVSEK